MKNVKNVKNVYNSVELKKVIDEIIKTQKTTKVVFHENEFGFDNDEVHILVEVDKYGDYIVTSFDKSEDEISEETTKTFTSRYTFNDYVWARCGW